MEELQALFTGFDGSMNMSVLIITVVLSTFILRPLKKKKVLDGFRWIVPLSVAFCTYNLWAYSQGQFTRASIWGGMVNGVLALGSFNLVKNLVEKRGFKMPTF